jgi:hypothetical protein
MIGFAVRTEDKSECLSTAVLSSCLFLKLTISNAREVNINRLMCGNIRDICRSVHKTQPPNRVIQQMCVCTDWYNYLA